MADTNRMSMAPKNRTRYHNAGCYGIIPADGGYDNGSLHITIQTSSRQGKS